MKGFENLLRSRKFWTAAMALAVLVLVESFGWGAEAAGQLGEHVVDLAMVLIGAIAFEDAAAKIKGRQGSQVRR